MEKQASIGKGVDATTVLLYYALVLVGFIAIFSVEFRMGDSFVQSLLELKKNYSRQVLFIGISSLVGVFILLTDSKFFTTIANLLYMAGILLMLLTFVIGKDISGSKSWIALGGGFNLQPAELCKVFTALALAKYLSRQETEFNNLRSHLIAFALTLGPALLSIAQKETGLALVYFSFFLVMYREGLPAMYLIVGFSFVVLFISSIVLSFLVYAIALGIIALIIIYYFWRQFKRNLFLLLAMIIIYLVLLGFHMFVNIVVFDKIMKPYQAARVLNMFGKSYIPRSPERIAQFEKEQASGKKRDYTYNVKQSKIAIGSGGLAGKGFLKGVTTQGDFVPEQHTDFIFTAIAESFGFWGSALLLGLYFFMLYRIITLAERQRSTFSRVYCYSVAAILLFHVMINISMTIGLMPVIGITLPLLSYGGSSLVTFTILIFIMLRLDADRSMVLR
ncbi:rod shape-determining protein RodA [Lacibacter sediminis]|uniref:Cell wall polymerase n=1 Tax=Lacibacter sediminis TaxID=2760713 RepID=A0A7G5XHZ4_9BACT|nr:rod shape-determining protein RodA [Lacibacter sediminis]QNA45097.1 rod shape-determining protein RodA [Lacibacter sediminis]